MGLSAGGLEEVEESSPSLALIAPLSPSVTGFALSGAEEEEGSPPWAASANLPVSEEASPRSAMGALAWPPPFWHCCFPKKKRLRGASLWLHSKTTWLEWTAVDFSMLL